MSAERPTRHPDLFGGGPSGDHQAAERSASAPGRTEPDPERMAGGAPLAARMRPRTIDEFEGQDHLLADGRAIRGMIDQGALASMIFWGPPGCGKTTLARLLAEATDATFVSISAVTSGVARIREITGEAQARAHATGRRTVLFCDEIHRFHKGQQDAFLPHVEAGTVVLIGATTENPSFEVVRPLLSRAPVSILEPLSTECLERIIRRALADEQRGLGSQDVSATDEAIRFIADSADGDARRALGVLETAAGLVGHAGRIEMDDAREALQHRFAAYDKSGEGHYNLISALHKAVRGSDPDASLYWLARMLQAGEDPLYIARRMVRMASEDIGLADPGALTLTVAARDAFHFLGPPEGELALAQAAVYLATAPKSNRVYRAWGAASSLARDTPAEPVPLHIRNAPTELMKDLGYGAGYRYDPDEPGGVAPQTYFPDAVGEPSFYEASKRGYEREVAERLRRWAELRGKSETRRQSDTDATDR